MLAIRRFETHYYLARGVPDRAAARQRLDRVAAQRVLAALAEQIAALPTAGQAVYCIRHLKVNLWLNLDQMDDPQIARRWSVAITKAVQQAIQDGQPNNVVRFESAAHYLAAFIEELTVGGARWMFARFENLRDLPIGRAIALVLSARPDLLLLLELQQRHLLEVVIQRMSLDDIGLLWAQGFGFEGLPDVPANWGRWLALLRVVPLQSGGGASRARNALRLYLTVALTEGGHDRGLAAVAQHFAWVHGALSRAPFNTLRPDQQFSILKTLFPEEMLVARAWANAVMASEAGREYLAALAVAANNNASSAVTLESSVMTNFAGLALLLPVIRAGGWHEKLSPEGLYQLLVAATGRMMAPLAWGDPAPRLLAGLTPREAQRARDSVIAWPELAAQPIYDTFSGLPGGALASLIVREFAQRLRGFSDSSGDFLCRQLINVPGRICITAQGIEVDLHRAPLGVALHMAGLDGEQGTIPWLDNRLLTIHLPEGNA